MKFFKYHIILFLSVLVILSCKNETQPEVKTIEVSTSENKTTLNPNAEYAKVEFNIKGMTCAMGCAKTIEKKMAKMDGVKMAKVDFDKELAMVEYDVSKVTPKSLEETVTKVSEVYKVQELKAVDNFTEDK